MKYTVTYPIRDKNDDQIHQKCKAAWRKWEVVSCQKKITERMENSLGQNEERM